MDIRRNNIDLIKYHTIAFDKQEMWQKIRAKKKRKNRLFILFFFFIGIAALVFLKFYSKNIQSKEYVKNYSTNYKIENNVSQNNTSSSVNNQKKIGLKKNENLDNFIRLINYRNLLNNEKSSNTVNSYYQNQVERGNENINQREQLDENKFITTEILPIIPQQVNKEKEKVVILENLVPKSILKRKNQIQLNLFSGISSYSYSRENNDLEYVENLKKYVNPLEELSVRINYRHFLNEKNQIDIGIGLIKSANMLTFIEESKTPIESLKSFEYNLVKVSNYKTYQSQYLLNLYSGYNRSLKLFNTKTDFAVGLSFVFFDYRKGYTIDENSKVVFDKEYYSDKNNLSFHFASKLKIIDRNKLNLSLGPEIRIGLSNSHSKSNILETKTKALGLGLQLGF